MSAGFHCGVLCDVIKSRDDHSSMPINDPLTSLARSFSSVLPKSYFLQYCGTFLERKI